MQTSRSKKLVAILLVFAMLLAYNVFYDDLALTEACYEPKPTTTIEISNPYIALDITKEIEYDWCIKKSADKDKIELSKGQSAEIEYTLKVDRTKASESKKISKLKASVKVKNKTCIPTEGFKLKAWVQKSDGKAITSPKTISTKNLKGSGYETYEYLIEDLDLIDGVNDYAVVFHATITNFNGNHGKEYGVKLEIPFNANKCIKKEIVTDEKATIKDKITVPDGFAAVASEEYWEVSDDVEITYTVDVKNDSVNKEGSYSLLNTVTLTECDSGKKRTDDEKVIIITDLSAAQLIGCVTAEGFMNYSKDYDWKIEKKADKNNITLAPGESETIKYTLTATRILKQCGGNVEKDGYVKGRVSVTNKGKEATKNLKINVQLQEKKGHGYIDIAGAKEIIEPDDELEPNESAKYNYQIAYAFDKNTKYRILVTVSTDNAAKDKELKLEKSFELKSFGKGYR